MDARMKIYTTRADPANTSSFISALIDTLAERGRVLLGRKADRAIPQLDLVALGELLLSRRGEASGVALAQTLLASYNTAMDSVRLDFLRALAERFGPSKSQIEHTIESLRKDPGPEALNALHAASEPRRQELIRRLNLAPGGTTGSGTASIGAAQVAGSEFS
jgi:malonyl-CoA decarboxylase